MLKRISLIFAGTVLAGLLMSPAVMAQKKPNAIQQAMEEYGKFFKEPTTPLEYWAAMKYEMAIGKYKLAETFLKGFLDQKPTDQDLLKIEQEEGMAGFLQLETIPQMRATAQPLIKRVTEITRKHFSDPVRIAKYIRNLDAGAQERAYAIDQLRAAGPYAVPYLIQALLQTDDLSMRARVLSAMRLLNRDMVPPVLAFLDADPAIRDSHNVPALRVSLIRLLQEKADDRAVPYLWYLAASPRQPDYVRQAATQALVAFLHTSPERLTLPQRALTALANSYYEHKVHFPTDRVTIWEWNGKGFVMPPLVATASQAEEYYGVRFARQAVDLDRRDLNAQVALLSLALDKGMERAGLDQPLDKAAPRVKELLEVVNPELLMAVLDRALQDQRLNVILGATRALGNTFAVRAVRAEEGRTPILVRALHYADRRVQMAAADAILSIPANPPARDAAQVVEVLRRALVSETHARAVVADGNSDRATAVARAVRQAGYDATTARTGREVVQALRQASDVDVVLVDHAVPYPNLPYLLGQIRADVYDGLLPVLVTVPPNDLTPAREDALQQYLQRYRNVWLVDTTLNPTALKRMLDRRIAEAGGKALSSNERKAYQAVAMLWLKRIATGEKTGYDIRPAEGAILEAMRSPDLGLLAIEATGRLSDSKAQQALADVVLTGNAKLKPAAAAELARQIQRDGLMLTAAQKQDLQVMFGVAQDRALRSNLARLLGVFHPSTALTGERLVTFGPPPLVTPATPAKK